MKIKIRPLNIVEKALDLIFLPFMCAIARISGGSGESHQRTHRWNCMEIPRTILTNKSLMCLVKGVAGKVYKQGNLLGNILFHIPFLGGAKNYAVISPINIPKGGWYAGWYNERVYGVSRILIHTPVRLLIGREDCEFIGFDSEGNQILVRVVHQDKIGCGGLFQRLPLL